MRNALDMISREIARATQVIIFIMATVMMTTLILQVFSRYVLSASLVWSEELALILFTWTTLLVAANLVRHDAHVKLDLLHTYLPKVLRIALQKCITILICCFCLVLTWSGVEYSVNTMGQVSAAMQLPIEVLHLAAPTCGALGAFHAFSRIFTPNSNEAKEMIG